jgi:hypothetical protein
MKEAIFQKPWRKAPVRWLFVSFLLSILAVAAVPSAAVAEETKPWEAVVFVHPNVFKFKTTIRDDGKGDGGGWQEANADVPISDARSSPIKNWKCNITVGMPLRTKADGKISAEKAAEVSAEVASQAVKQVMPEQPPGQWAPGTFCVKFKAAMRNIFRANYKSLGARVE